MDPNRWQRLWSLYHAAADRPPEERAALLAAASGGNTELEREYNATLTGETKPSHEGKMDFLDNRRDASTGTLRSRAVIPNKDLSILPGPFGRVRLVVRHDEP